MLEEGVKEGRSEGRSEGVSEGVSEGERSKVFLRCKEVKSKAYIYKKKRVNEKVT